jgi:hypothetical protein
MTATAFRTLTQSTLAGRFGLFSDVGVVPQMSVQACRRFLFVRGADFGYGQSYHFDGFCMG